MSTVSGAEFSEKIDQALQRIEKGASKERVIKTFLDAVNGEESFGDQDQLQFLCERIEEYKKSGETIPRLVQRVAEALYDTPLYNTASQKTRQTIDKAAGLSIGQKFLDLFKTVGRMWANSSTYGVGPLGKKSNEIQEKLESEAFRFFKNQASLEVAKEGAASKLSQALIANVKSNSEWRRLGITETMCDAYATMFLNEWKKMEVAEKVLVGVAGPHYEQGPVEFEDIRGILEGHMPEEKIKEGVLSVSVLGDEMRD